MDKNFDWKYNGPVEIINVLGLTEGIILTRTDKSVSIEMYHVIRIISNPNLSLPCDIRNMFSEFCPSKLPDIIVYDEGKEWLFLIEVVTSHGPVSPKRMLELEDFLKESKVGNAASYYNKANNTNEDR